MGYEGALNKLTFQKALLSPQWKFLIHTILHCLSSKPTSWNEFSINIALAVICLATNQNFSFSRFIFDGGGDSLVRAATTASLDIQQDSSNIAKTQSKATLNEPNPQGEGSSSGPGCQETIGGTMAQIRPEGAPIQSSDPPLSTGNIVGSEEDMMEHAIELTDHVPQTPHDSPLSGGHIPGSDEGSMTLKELTDLCTTSPQEVLDLEKVKTAQAKEIDNLKKRVTKLEQRQSSRISSFHPFRAEVIVKDKGSGEKGGSTPETVSTVRPDISVARLEVSTAEPKTPPTTTTLFDDEDVTIIDTLVKMKSLKAKEKGVAFKDADDSARPIRSITTLQHLPTIDPTDKGRFTHAQLKSKSLQEIQKLYTKEQKWIDAFVPICSEEDEKRVGSIKKRAAGSSLKQKSPKKKNVNDQESVDCDKEL
nr:glutamic acid-rich protein-like [Tanacetum cinerariifolium]